MLLVFYTMRGLLYCEHLLRSSTSCDMEATLDRQEPKHYSFTKFFLGT